MHKIFALCRVVCLAVLCMYLSSLAHVEENSGKALQLYSYYTTNPPKINACLTDKTNDNGVQRTDNDEWKDAYIRYLTIKTASGADSTKMAFFFMNDADYFYVGVSCNFNNMGNNTTVKLFFDQGANGGSHNDYLDGDDGIGEDNGEYRCEVTTDSDIKNEYSFNGTSWVQQNNGSEVFEASGENYGGALMQVEFKIPIRSNPAPDDNHSYLDVDVKDEFGLFIDIYTQNSGGMDLYWHDTNGDINDAATSPGWMDLRLGVSRSFVTFYATHNANGNPTIDGNINGGNTPDDGWRGCYTRNLTLTNFMGSSMDATLYLVGDETSDSVYVGLKVEDDDNDGGDYCQIYQEENTANPSTGRDYLLNNNTENALKADGTYGSGDDIYWNGTAWVSDGSNAADYAGQNADIQWYGSGSFYEYEYVLNRSSANANDINMADNNEMGFFIRYHDAAGGGSDYYWDYSPNVDAISIDENNIVYLAAGWPGLQLGAPYVQVIFPEDGSDVEGVLNVRIYAVDEEGAGPAGIDSAHFYLASGRVLKTSLTRIAGTQEWSGTLDIGQLVNGSDTLVIEVGDNDGIVVERLVEIEIANGSGSVTAPWVRITSPTPGSTVSGDQTISFTKNPGSGTVIRNLTVYIDGDSTEIDSSATSYNWSTNSLVDGSHTIQLKVINEAGMSGISPVANYIIDNSPTVSITSPQGGDEVSGKIALSYVATPKGTAAIDSIWLMVDGKFSKNLEPDSTDTLNTTTLPDAEHTIQVRAQDNTGKTGVSELLTLVVRNSPAVTLDSPLPDATLTGTVTITFTENPVLPAAIVKREVYIDGGLVDTAATDSTYIWKTQELNDGQHTIQIKVTDTNNRYGLSALVSVTVFNTPVVIITAPSGTSEISGIDTIKFTVSYAPGTLRDTTGISFNGGLWIPTTDSLSYTWVTTDFLDGNHTVQVRATATNGKTGYSQVSSFKVSNVPYVNITTPTGGEALCGIYTVSFVVTPVYPAAIVSREISIDGNPWTDSLVDSASYTMSTTGWEDGAHTIQVRATDDKGRNGFSSQRSFIVDNSPPITADPQVEYPDNGNSVNINSDILITVLAKDVQVGLRTDSGVVLTSDFIDTASSVTYLMRDDGQNGDNVENDNIFSSLVKVTTDTTGTIGYSIKAEDLLGNAVTLTSCIQLDNTPPEISVFTLIPEPEVTINPAGKRSYFDKLILRGEYSDEGGSGLSRVFVSVKNDSGDHVNNSPIDLSPKDSVFSRIINLVPGINFISLEARDCAGNTTIRNDTVTYIEPKATEVIGRDGGVIASPNGVKAVIPEDAMLKSGEITITKVLPIDQPDPVDASVKLLNTAHEFGPDGMTFRKPVYITLSYTEADLDIDQDGVNDFDPDKFTIVFWDGETWLNAGNAAVDTVNRLVSVSVNHFTTFDIAERETFAASQLIAYWTHNPVKSSEGSYFNYEIPEAGTVFFAIVDMAGDLVYQLIARGKPVQPGTYSVGWRGQNVAERFSGAGLYVYVFRYTKNSTGKSTIIRKPIGLLK